MRIEHRGFDVFRKGVFGNGGVNLFVDATGAIRRIMENDLNDDGYFDIVFPNSHGYIERGPTTIYARNANGEWLGRDLTHDSCWKTKIADVDGDGYDDLIVVNAENGVSSVLKSYVYYGGQDGLTGERGEFPTEGAYDVVCADLTGNGHCDLIFTSAWTDHHMHGYTFKQKVYVQESKRKFRDATEEFSFTGQSVVSLLYEDLNNDGYPEFVMAGYRGRFTEAGIGYIYYGGLNGISKKPETLPTYLAMNVRAVDLNRDGFKELIFAGGNRMMIYWNNDGVFSEKNIEIIDLEGYRTQFFGGRLAIDIADIDADGLVELIIGYGNGLEIRKENDLHTVWQKVEGFHCSCVKAVDFDGDGRYDIIAGRYGTPESYDVDSFIFHNVNNQYSIDKVTFLPTHGVMDVQIHDFDNDGRSEIIFCNTMRGPSQFTSAFPCFVYNGGPDGKFLPENRKEYHVPFGAHSYLAVDLDNDLHPELVLSSADGVGARVFSGQACGPDPENFFDIAHIGITGGLLVGDFNHNGWLDLILSAEISTADEIEKSTLVAYGGPDGFSSGNMCYLPVRYSSFEAVCLADLNNDGYLDFIALEEGGLVSVFLGGKDGFDPGNKLTFTLKDYNSAKLFSVTAADCDKDGKLELYITTAGHYTRVASHLYVLRDFEAGYPLDRQTVFETGGTTGFLSFADMYKTGWLDMIMPFYSTTETRELPMRIFKNDRNGGFDFSSPVTFDCLASIASYPVDLTRNGYPDLFLCFHRNDIGHAVDSLLIYNGPEGLDFSNPQRLPGLGPHDFMRNVPANMMDRSESEFYISPPIVLDSPPSKILWEAVTPHQSSLSFRVRYAESSENLSYAVWSEAVTENGGELHPPAGAKYMQYQAEFVSPALCNSPRLYAVIIE